MWKYHIAKVDYFLNFIKSITIEYYVRDVAHTFIQLFSADTKACHFSYLGSTAHKRIDEVCIARRYSAASHDMTRQKLTFGFHFLFSPGGMSRDSDPYANPCAFPPHVP